MNRHSLINYISIFFLFLLLMINTLLFFQYHFEKKDAIERAFKTHHLSMREIERAMREGLLIEAVKERLKKRHGVEILDNHVFDTLKAENPIARRHDLIVYDYNGFIYMYFNNQHHPGPNILFRYIDKEAKEYRVIWLAFFINLSLVLFFIFVIRRIWPLRKLKSSIVEFANGNMDIQTNISGKDEIAEVSQEFDKAIKKIKYLQESRNLFLRNIMHELKTPISKCKLIANLMDDKKNASRLSVIFDRFEYLLGEFVKIERATSNELKLDKKYFRTVDVLDNALDILMLETDSINLNVQENSSIHIDYELFSIAIKNMIDNALKYGTEKPTVIINSSLISIISKGKNIDDSIFEKVFNRKFEDSSKGLGIGIYITKNIIEKHGFKLKYIYKNNENIFEINFDEK